MPEWLAKLSSLEVTAIVGVVGGVVGTFIRAFLKSYREGQSAPAPLAAPTPVSQKPSVDIERHFEAVLRLLDGVHTTLREIKHVGESDKHRQGEIVNASENSARALERTEEVLEKLVPVQRDIQRQGEINLAVLCQIRDIIRENLKAS